MPKAYFVVRALVEEPLRKRFDAWYDVVPVVGQVIGAFANGAALRVVAGLVVRISRVEEFVRWAREIPGLLLTRSGWLELGDMPVGPLGA
jgi:hypothetical protein